MACFRRAKQAALSVFDMQCIMIVIPCSGFIPKSIDEIGTKTMTYLEPGYSLLKPSTYLGPALPSFNPRRGQIVLGRLGDD